MNAPARYFLVLLLLFIGIHFGSSLEAKITWRGCGKFVARTAVIAAIPLAGLGAHQAWSNASYRAKPTDTSHLYAEGASISSGTAASLFLQMRLRHHFQESNIDLQNLMGNERVVVLADYFFPTNFPEIDQLQGEELKSLVKARLLDYRSRYDYVLVGPLLDAQSLSKNAKQRLSTQPDHPVNFIDRLLSPDEKRRQAVQWINDALVEVAVMDRGFILLDTQGFAESLSPGAYVHPSGREYLVAELFPDNLHLNDNGQAVFFNLVIRPALERIPSLTGRIPPMPMRNLVERTVQTANQFTFLGRVASDFQELAIQEQVGAGGDFAIGESGNYWASFGGESKSEIRESQRLNDAGALASLYQDELSRLSAIQSKVVKSLWMAPSGFVVSRGEFDGRRSLTVNFSQILFYTNIRLVETMPGSGAYEGYGYDFWWSVDKENPPRVNYYFSAEVSADNPQQINFTWRIYPLVRNERGERVQEDPLIRLGSLSPEWSNYLDQNGDQLPFVEFSFSSQVK